MEIRTNRGFPRHLEKPREPRSALPHFSQAGAVLHLQRKTEGNGNARSRKIISMTFGSCSAPHPSLNLTGHEPTFVNRTARGYGSVSSVASSNRVGNLRGLRSAAGRASIRVWCRLVLPSRNGNSRRGRATDGAVSCSLICVVFVSSALRRFLFLDWGSPHTCWVARLGKDADL